MLNIPTDKIYKFCAIGGLTLLCSGIYGLYLTFEIWHINQIEDHQRILYWQKECAKSSIELEKAIRNRKAREKKTDEDDRRIRNKDERVKSKIKLYETQYEMYVDDINFSYRAYKQNIYLFCSIIIIIVGIIASTYGFRKWHLSEIKHHYELKNKNDNKTISKKRLPE